MGLEIGFRDGDRDRVRTLLEAFVILTSNKPINLILNLSLFNLPLLNFYPFFNRCEGVSAAVRRARSRARTRATGHRSS